MTDSTPPIITDLSILFLELLVVVVGTVERVAMQEDIVGEETGAYVELLGHSAWGGPL